MTNSSKDIVPWICHVCIGEFDTPNGGICARCKLPSCRLHLDNIQGKENVESYWVCEKCLTDEEKTNKEKKKLTLKLPGKWLKGNAAKSRRGVKPDAKNK